ncbi:putative BZIP domain-containing protein [Seiridium cardinale]|uniref:BZIP domain-containing protein n=1 Tax=Seiridium cardinale TaxID=138064 RepID=A0ABR2XTQ9_9PEZI
MLDSEKKRARDRRAQQNLRDKRSAYVRALEERAANAENELQETRQALWQLQQSQLTISAEQEVAGFPPILQAAELDIQATHPSSAEQPGYDGTSSPVPERVAPSTGQPSAGSQGECDPWTSRKRPQSDFQTVIRRVRSGSWEELELPRWRLIPYHEEDNMMSTDMFGLWIKGPNLVRASPESPAPLQLLYGSKTNFLANLIHEGFREWACGECERLAGGWLVYHLIKWITQPTKARFETLHPYQRPVPEQICRPHPFFIDCLPWPQLRGFLVERQHLYDPVQVMVLLACCIKVRWPWNQSPLEPDDDGQLRMKSDFVNSFSKLQGWYLTNEFTVKYPELVQGLDREIFATETNVGVEMERR